ncbi:MAG: hypothetical protein IJ484_06255 [Oscillospiraceae bacterium]|nr:hypothetical protein [Oscillospiraceae bacterium]
MMLQGFLLVLCMALFCGAMWQFVQHVRHQGEATSRTAVLGVLLFYLGVLAVRLAANLYLIGLPAGDPNHLPLNGWEAVMDSAVHAMQTFSTDEDYTLYLTTAKELCLAITGSQLAADLLGGFLAVQNLLAPVVGGAILLSLLSNLFPGLKLFFQRGRVKFVFSELNERSVLLAEALRRYEGSLGLVGEEKVSGPKCIVFTDAYVDLENEQRAELLQRARAVGAICLEEDVTSLKLRGTKRVLYFLMDEEERANLDTAIALAEKIDELCAETDGVDVLLFSRDANASSVAARLQDKHNKQDGSRARLVIKVVRDHMAMVYRLLEDRPLFLPLLDPEAERKISLLVLGDGPASREMIRAAYWCGQVLDADGSNVPLEIHVAAPGGCDDLRSELAMAMPGVRMDGTDPYAAIYFYDCGVRGAGLEKLFRETPALEGCNYVFCALEGDSLNMDVALWLRRRYDLIHLTGRRGRTFIHYMVEDHYLCSDQNASNASGDWKGCVAFGSLRDRYSVDNVFVPVLEHNAYEVNKHHGPDDWRKFQQNEYKRLSSVANVVHSRSKVFSRMPEAFSVDETGALHLNWDDEAMRAGVTRDAALACLEHRRWNAYTISIGFRCPTWDELNAYMAGTDAKSEALRLHPCLVESHPGKWHIRQSLGEGDWQGEWAFEQVTDRDELDNFSLRFNQLLRSRYPDAWQEVLDHEAQVAAVIAGHLNEDGTVVEMFACRDALCAEAGISYRAAELAVPTDYKRWDYDMLINIPEFARAIPVPTAQAR